MSDADSCRVVHSHVLHLNLQGRETMNMKDTELCCSCIYSMHIIVMFDLKGFQSVTKTLQLMKEDLHNKNFETDKYSHGKNILLLPSLVNLREYVCEAHDAKCVCS